MPASRRKTLHGGGKSNLTEIKKSQPSKVSEFTMPLSPKTPGWTSGRPDLFNTPKSLSPVLTKRTMKRTSVMVTKTLVTKTLTTASASAIENVKRESLYAKSLATSPAMTRARRASVYVKGNTKSLIPQITSRQASTATESSPVKQTTKSDSQRVKKAGKSPKRNAGTRARKTTEVKVESSTKKQSPKRKSPTKAEPVKKKAKISSSKTVETVLKTEQSSRVKVQTRNTRSGKRKSVSPARKAAAEGKQTENVIVTSKTSPKNLSRPHSQSPSPKQKKSKEGSKVPPAQAKRALRSSPAQPKKARKSSPVQPRKSSPVQPEKSPKSSPVRPKKKASPKKSDTTGASEVTRTSRRQQSTQDIQVTPVKNDTGKQTSELQKKSAKKPRRQTPGRNVRKTPSPKRKSISPSKKSPPSTKKTPSPPKSRKKNSPRIAVDLEVSLIKTPGVTIKKYRNKRSPRQTGSSPVLKTDKVGERSEKKTIVSKFTEVTKHVSSSKKAFTREYDESPTLRLLETPTVIKPRRELASSPARSPAAFYSVKDRPGSPKILARAKRMSIVSSSSKEYEESSSAMKKQFFSPRVSESTQKSKIQARRSLATRTEVDRSQASTKTPYTAKKSGAGLDTGTQVRSVRKSSRREVFETQDSESSSVDSVDLGMTRSLRKRPVIVPDVVPQETPTEAKRQKLAVSDDVSDSDIEIVEEEQFDLAEESVIEESQILNIADKLTEHDVDPTEELAVVEARASRWSWCAIL